METKSYDATPNFIRLTTDGVQDPLRGPPVPRLTSAEGAMRQGKSQGKSEVSRRQDQAEKNGAQTKQLRSSAHAGGANSKLACLWSKSRVGGAAMCQGTLPHQNGRLKKKSTDRDRGCTKACTRTTNCSNSISRDRSQAQGAYANLGV